MPELNMQGETLHLHAPVGALANLFVVPLCNQHNELHQIKWQVIPFNQLNWVSITFIYSIFHFSRPSFNA